MIAALILAAATLTMTAPKTMPGFPDSVTYGERPMLIELRAWRQSSFAVCCCPHNSSPEWWRICWPIVLRQANATVGWTRRAGAGERVTFPADSAGPSVLGEGLPRQASYRVRAIDDCGNAGAWSRWVSIP